MKIYNNEFQQENRNSGTGAENYPNFGLTAKIKNEEATQVQIFLTF